MRAVIVVVVVVAFAASCGSGSSGSGKKGASGSTVTREAPMSLSLTSALFADGELIPTRSTCDGENVSPPLTWTGVPSGTAELALTMEDPDAPSGTFVHWVMWGIHPTTHELDEGVVPEGLHQGKNGGGKTGYTGPCPPKGNPAHHYEFTLYALSSSLSLTDGATIDELRDAMKGKITAEGRLTGLYGR